MTQVNDSTILRYPNFKSVCIEDKETIDTFTQSYPPYCDFTFSNLHTWRDDTPSEYTFLNGNLVIRTLSNKCKRKIVSVLGENEINKTIKELLASHKSLNYVPETVIQKITEKKDLIIEEDFDNSDYVFSLEKSFELSGSELHDKRSDIKRFQKRYPNVEMHLLDLTDNKITIQVRRLFSNWMLAKKLHDDPTLVCEYNSFERFLMNQNVIANLCLGFFDSNKLIGFHIIEPLKNGWLLSHFAKGDNNYKEIYSYMFYKISEYFHISYTNINYQMDMGSLSLRDYKKRWRPTKMLRKYNIKKGNNIV